MNRPLKTVKYSIKIESIPKHATKDKAISTQIWNVYGLIEARELILRQRIYHSKESQAYKIYENDKMIFDSRFIIDK